jgi:hypothetical protein
MARTFDLQTSYSGRSFVIIGKILNPKTNAVDDYFKVFQEPGETQDAFVERARKKAVTRIGELDLVDEERAKLQAQLDSLKEKVGAVHKA